MTFKVRFNKKTYDIKTTVLFTEDAISIFKVFEQFMDREQQQLQSQQQLLPQQCLQTELFIHVQNQSGPG